MPSLVMPLRGSRVAIACLFARALVRRFFVSGAARMCQRGQGEDCEWPSMAPLRGPGCAAAQALFASAKVPMLAQAPSGRLRVRRCFQVSISAALWRCRSIGGCQALPFQARPLLLFRTCHSHSTQEGLCGIDSWRARSLARVSLGKLDIPSEIRHTAQQKFGRASVRALRHRAPQCGLSAFAPLIGPCARSTAHGD